MLRQFAYLSFNNKRKAKQKRKINLISPEQDRNNMCFTLLAFYLHGYLMHFIVKSCFLCYVDNFIFILKALFL